MRVQLVSLAAGDEAAVDAFLARHAASSMIMRSNIRRAGLAYRGEAYQGTYMAATADGAIRGVAAHYRNGMLALQAPDDVTALAPALVAQSGRPVNGLTGPWRQVAAARTSLGLDGRPARHAERDPLFRLALAELIVPALLASGAVECRRPRRDELDILIKWRTASRVETLNARADAHQSRISAEEIEQLDARGAHWVLLDEGRLVAYSAFNADLPDMVQVGGVWTPPELRGRGYARAVVAGSLLDARAAGVDTAILFARPDNKAALAAYRAIGFRQVGEYGMVLFGAVPPP